jgi:hypothetical protein
MCCLQSVADVAAVAQSLAERQRTLAKAIRETFAFQILHDQIADPVLRSDVVEMANVRVIQRRDGPGFAVKALFRHWIVGERLGKDLDRDGAIEAGVAGAIHLTHAARTQRGLNFIGTEFCARSKSQGSTPLLGAIITCKAGCSERGDSGWLVSNTQGILLKLTLMGRCPMKPRLGAR